MIMASAACILCAYGARGQEIAALQRRMASGRDAVRVTETADAAAAELHGLLQIGDGKELRAQLAQMAADGHGTVAVGVRFYNAKEFHALR